MGESLDLGYCVWRSSCSDGMMIGGILGGDPVFSFFFFSEFGSFRFMFVLSFIVSYSFLTGWVGGLCWGYGMLVWCRGGDELCYFCFLL